MANKKISTELKNYLEFKISQFARLTGFDTTQENAQEKLKAAAQPHLKGWISEAIAAGN